MRPALIEGGMEAWAAEQLYDDEAGTAAAAYGLSGFPFLVFVDADGQVVRRLSDVLEHHRGS